MKGLLFLAALLLVAGFIWMPGESEAPAASPARSTRLDTASLMAAAQAMPAVQQMQVQVKLQNLRTALYMYVEETGDVPTESEGLRPLTRMGGLVREADILDAWGREFVYRCDEISGNQFFAEFEVEVFSAGADGIADTADDIHVR